MYPDLCYLPTVSRCILLCVIYLQSRDASCSVLFTYSLKMYSALCYLPIEVFTGDNPLERLLSNAAAAAAAAAAVVVAGAVPVVISVPFPLRFIGERDGAVGSEGSDGFGVGTLGTNSSRMCTNMFRVRTTCSRSNSAHEDNCKHNETSIRFDLAVQCNAKHPLLALKS